MQFGGRAAVEGRIGRQRRRDSAKGCGTGQQGTGRLDRSVPARIGMLEARMVGILWVDAEAGRRVISMRKASGRERKRFARYLS